jgi:dipeptidyl aminopeptidase/acylaminoacyl peptidase
MKAFVWFVAVAAGCVAVVPRAAAGDADAALRAAVAVERAREPAPRLSRAQFIAEAPLPDVSLSPDGRFVAYMVARGDERSLWLLPTAGGAARNLLAHTDARMSSWSRDGRWLFLQGARAVSSYDIATGAGVRIELGGETGRETMMIDRSQPAALVVREEVRLPRGRRWRIVRIDAHGRRSVLREDDRWIQDITLGMDGRIAFLMRKDGPSSWAIERVDAGGGTRRVMRWSRMESGSLLSSMPGGALYLRCDCGDGDLKRVLRLDPDGSLHEVHADPRGVADLEDVALDPASGIPAIVSYRAALAASYGLGDAKRHVDAIRARFPGRVLDIRIGDGPDARWLVSDLGSAPLPRWHLYDPRSGAFRDILGGVTPRTAPPESAYAREIPFDYLASDGMLLHGFLLLPPGADPSRTPLVAQVHGGPFSHNEEGYGRYDDIAQFLANRGYAVFQPNFRGSTGLGRAYGLAAHGDYGNGRVQQDVIDGVRHLLAQGIGDSRRVGIVGHSYGGYAALLGVTFAPELFKVGVAGSPPADFGWLSRWNVDHGILGMLPGIGLEQALRWNGIDVRDPATLARLHAQSPLAHVAELRRPLALLAGGRDERVPIRAVVDYAARLRANRKPLTLLVEPEGAHSPRDPLPREGYLYVLETMLERHLGGVAPEPPSPALRAYLQDNLRLAGPEFAGFGQTAAR